jgi:outer membrane protein
MKKIFLLLIFILNFENSYADNKIAYININHILNNSIVGLSISKQIQKIKEKKINEFMLIEKKLSDKENDIIKKKNIVEKNELENDINKLKEDIVNFSKQKKKFNKEINEKKLKYTKIVLNALNPIISKYVEENSISIVFPKKNIIIAKKNLDITNPVMDLLNNQLNKIDF